MKNVQKVLAGVVFGVAGMGAAQAEWSANIGAASAYIFRGDNLSDNAAISGGIDWSSNNSGLYAGTWVTSADDADELDIYGGYAFDLGGGVGLDLGVIAYLYPSSDELGGTGSHGNSTELYVGVGSSAGSATIWYNFGADNVEDDEFVYAELNTDLPLFGQFGLGLHLGYKALTGDAFDGVDDDGIVDYGVSVNAGDFALSVTNTDKDPAGQNDRPEVVVSWSKSWEGLGNAK